MASSGTRKAALLLMSLDAASAAQLLKDARPEVAARIATELACLDASGKPEDASQPAQEFLVLLGKSAQGRGAGKFVKDLLDSAMGKDKRVEILSRAQEMVAQRDPFGPIRTLAPADLAKALEGESPSVVAMVLSELPPKKSAELVTLLEEKTRVESLRGIASGEEPSAEARRRVAGLVLSRLQAPTLRRDGRREHQTRKVAVLLRGLSGDLRGSLVQAIAQSDPQSGTAIQDAMVTWGDILSIADRSLQEFLRGVESRKLAMALVGAAPAIMTKLRSNMSERASAMLEEEMSLLSSPKAQDIADAREELLKALREMNANNKLSFVED